MDGAQRPLELILARNLLTSLSTPAFLVGVDGALLFYNEAAGGLLGVSFEDAGHMAPEDWTSSFGPFDESTGEAIPIEELPLTAALRDGRPAHSQFLIRSARGQMHEIAASALPIIGNEHGSSGAIVIFWPLEPDGRDEGAAAAGTEAGAR